MKKTRSSLPVLHRHIKDRIKSLSIYPIKSYEILIDELAFLTYCVQKCEKIYDGIKLISPSSDNQAFEPLADAMADLKMQLDASEKTKYQCSPKL